MSKVLGENFILRHFDGGIWKTLACARSADFNVDTETIETTVTGSGNWKTCEPTVHSFSGQSEGIIALNESGQLTLPELRAIQFAKTKLLTRFTTTAIDGTIYIEECYLYITNSVSTGADGGIATFSISYKGTGSITQVFTPPPPTTGIVYRYPAVGSTAPVAAGTVSITIAGLGSKSILAVFKDGIGNNDIITSGTPVDKEVLYETSGSDGVFTWAIPFDGESFFILYQNT